MIDVYYSLTIIRCDIARAIADCLYYEYWTSGSAMDCHSLRIDKSSEVYQAGPVDPALNKAILKVRIHISHLTSLILLLIRSLSVYEYDTQKNFLINFILIFLSFF